MADRKILRCLPGTNALSCQLQIGSARHVSVGAGTGLLHFMGEVVAIVPSLPGAGKSNMMSSGRVI